MEPELEMEGGKSRQLNKTLNAIKSPKSQLGSLVEMQAAVQLSAQKFPQRPQPTATPLPVTKKLEGLEGGVKPFKPTNLGSLEGGGIEALHQPVDSSFMSFGELKMRVQELEKENQLLKKALRQFEAEKAQEVGDGDEFGNEISFSQIPASQFKSLKDQSNLKDAPEIKIRKGVSKGEQQTSHN